MPDSVEPHFTLATTGVLYAEAAGADLIYSTTDCLASDPADCQPPDSPYYAVRTYTDDTRCTGAPYMCICTGVCADIRPGSTTIKA